LMNRAEVVVHSLGGSSQSPPFGSNVVAICLKEYSMKKKKLSDKRVSVGRKTVKKPKKSNLAKQAEKLFSFNEADLVTLPQAPSYSTGPVILQTFTTYSVCEDPIPDPRKQKQA